MQKTTQTEHLVVVLWTGECKFVIGIHLNGKLFIRSLGEAFAFCSTTEGKSPKKIRQRQCVD